MLGDAARATLGDYSLALSVFGFALLLQQDLLCLPFTVLRAGQRPRQQRYFAGSVFLFQLALSVAAVVLLGMVTLPLGWLQPGPLIQAFLALMFAMPTMLLREYLRRYSLAVHNARAAALWDGVTLIIVVATLLGLWCGGALNCWTTLAALGVINLLVGGVWLAAVIGQWRWGTSRRVSRDAAAVWKFASWNLASGILACAPVFLLPWILATSAGREEAGLFAACTALIGFPTVITAGMQNYLVPRVAARFAKEGVEGLQGEVLIGALALNSIATAFLLLVLATGDGLMRWIFTDNFAGSGAALLALAGALWFHSINAAFTSYLQAAHKSQANVLPNVADLVVTLGFVIALAPTWGATGAAIARLCGAVAAMVLRSIALHQLLFPARFAAGSTEATPA